MRHAYACIHCDWALIRVNLKYRRFFFPIKVDNNSACLLYCIAKKIYQSNSADVSPTLISINHSFSLSHRNGTSSQCRTNRNTLRICRSLGEIARLRPRSSFRIHLHPTNYPRHYRDQAGNARYYSSDYVTALSSLPRNNGTQTPEIDNYIRLIRFFFDGTR